MGRGRPGWWEQVEAREEDKARSEIEGGVHGRATDGEPGAEEAAAEDSVWSPPGQGVGPSHSTATRLGQVWSRLCSSSVEKPRVCLQPQEVPLLLPRLVLGEAHQCISRVPRTARCRPEPGRRWGLDFTAPHHSAARVQGGKLCHLEPSLRQALCAHVRKTVHVTVMYVQGQNPGHSCSTASHMTLPPQ